jgi:3-phytase
MGGTLRSMNQARIKQIKRCVMGAGVVLAGVCAGLGGGCGSARVVAEKDVVMVMATYETQPVLTVEDAADDACVWVHPQAGLAGSGVAVPYLVVGTDKKRGLMVYGPMGSGKGGQVVQEVLDGRMNNVEIVQGIKTDAAGLNMGVLDMVFATNRTSNGVSMYVVGPETGTLARVGDEKNLKGIEEVYGIAAYLDPRMVAPGNLMSGGDLGVRVVVACKSGLLVRYKLVVTPARNFWLDELERVKLDSQIEGVVADLVHRRLFVGEEAKGMWVYDLDNLQSPKLMDRVGPAEGGMLAADVEGVAIITEGFDASDNGEGYVIVSAQMEDRFAVYERQSLQYVCSIGFAMADGDRVTHTDGIAICNRPVGIFERGVVVVQDDNDGKPQNFKVIDVRRVLEGIEQGKMAQARRSGAQSN